MRRRPVMVGVLLTVGVGALFGPSLVGARVLSANDVLFSSPPFSTERPAGLGRPSNPYLADPVFVFHPQMQKARSAVRNLRIPLWDPNIGAGRPLLAAQLGAPLFPLTWLSFALPFWFSLAWIAALRILIAGAGTWALCRRLGLSTAASAVGAVSFAFGSAVVLAVEAPTLNIYALLPWLLFFTDRITQRARWHDTAAMGVLSGLTLLGGHPESVLVTAFAVVSFAAFSLSRSRQPRRAAGRLVAAAAIAGGIGAVAVLPFLELLSHSGDLYRGAPRLAGRLFTESFFFPDRWGRPDKAEFAVSASSYAGRGVYFGAPALIVMIPGLVVRPRPSQVFFCVLAVASFLLLADLPGATWLVQHLPVLSTMRTDYFLWPMTFSLAILAAFGLDALQRANSRSRWRMLAAMVTVALGPLAWALANHGHLSQISEAIKQQPAIHADIKSVEIAELASYVRWAGLAVATLAIVTVGIFLRRRKFMGGAVAVLLLADLVTLGYGYHPQVAKATAEPRVPPAIRYLQSARHSQRYVSEVGAMGPNLSDRYGIYDMDAFSPPIIDRYARLYTALGGTLVVNLGRTNVDLSDPRSRALMRLFATSRVLAAPVPSRSEAGLRVELPIEGQRVLGYPAALPRAWVAYDWRPATDPAEAVREVAPANAAGAERRPVIEGAAAGPPARHAPGPARLAVDGDTRVVVQADLVRPGYVLLGDTYYPGWTASVDGRPARILPANVAFRAVAVGAGHHRVEFAYRPTSFIAGAALSALALLAAAVLFVAGLRPRANTASRAPTARPRPA